MSNINQNKYNCPLEYTQRLIGGKWKPIILWYLSTKGIMRYGELKKSLIKISDKMLSQQLKELEGDKLIYRKQYPQIPPKVEYSISKKGKTLIPLLELMHTWAMENIED